MIEQRIGQEPLVPFEERYPELNRALGAVEDAGETYHVVVLTQDGGIHIATSTTPDNQDVIIELMTVVVRWVLETLVITKGSQLTERLFAMFVTAMAHQMGWSHRHGRERMN